MTEGKYLLSLHTGHEEQALVSLCFHHRMVYRYWFNYVQVEPVAHKGFVQPSFGFHCSLSSLHTNYPYPYLF